MAQTVIERILALLFGHKYYAVIINTRGIENYEIASCIHRTKESALEHRKRIESTLSYSYIETISFRSRNEY